MTSARDRVLASVRTALGRSDPLSEAQTKIMRTYLAEHPVGPRPQLDWEPVARFSERARLLSSTVEEVAALEAVPAAVAAYLRAHALPLQAIVWPQFERLDWSHAGVSVAARKAQDQDMVGITGCFCAIAETGTLLTLSGADAPPSTSLLPETHIAIVPCARIVRSMEDAWALVRSERGALPRATNFISGPSRTADIEQTLVLGAHGPYRVHVVLVRS